MCGSSAWDEWTSMGIWMEFLTGPDFLLKVNGVPVYDYPLNVEGKLNLEEWDRG